MNINLTIIGQSLAFIIFIVFCMKAVWPALLAVMAEREKKIADGLEAADRASKDLELAKEKAISQLHEAKQEAATIIDAANKRANQIVDEAKEKAREEGERLKAAAQADIEQEFNRAKEELRSKVATLVIAGAEQVLETSVDASKHNGLVEKLAAEL